MELNKCDLCLPPPGGDPYACDYCEGPYPIYGNLNIDIRSIVQWGLFTTLRYEYRINGHLWEDQTSYRPISFGNSINKLSDSTSKNPKYYPPLVIE